MILLRQPSDLFTEIVKPLSVEETTKAYLVGLFTEFIKVKRKENNSVVLAYAHACTTGQFDNFQSLGDWVLWSMSFFPEYHGENEKIVLELGRRSYETCWKLLRGKWKIYEELADELPVIVKHIHANK